MNENNDKFMIYLKGYFDGTINLINDLHDVLSEEEVCNENDDAELEKTGELIKKHLKQLYDELENSLKN